MGWKWDPPGNWEVEDTDAWGLCWILEGSNPQMPYRVPLNEASPGPDGFRWAMEQVVLAEIQLNADERHHDDR